MLSFLDQKQFTGHRIKNVWVYNFETELEKISNLIVLRGFYQIGVEPVLTFLNVLIFM